MHPAEYGPALANGIGFILAHGSTMMGSGLRRDKAHNMQGAVPKTATIPGGRLVEVEAALALARARNFRVAAAEVGLSPTAFSRTITLLENRLGVQLFVRTTRSVGLTAAGERFLARAEPALRDLSTAMTEAQEERDLLQGTLRLTCAIGAARRILKPVLLAFIKRYPDMRIELITDARLADIIAAEIDAGFRIGGAVPRDMAKVPVGPVLRQAVVASPAVVRDYGTPNCPEDLLRRPCIRFRRADGTIYGWEFRRGTESCALDVPGALTLDDPSLAHQAALAGAGYAYLARWNTEDDVAAGRLESVLEAWLPEQEGLCLYYPKARHPPAGLRALISLVEGMRSI
jgi:DNA-binding transcriptional LysR family regulator